MVPAGVACFVHEVDHVVAGKHGATSAAANVALACWRCNRHTGSDVATLDQEWMPFKFRHPVRANAQPGELPLGGCRVHAKET